MCIILSFFFIFCSEKVFSERVQAVFNKNDYKCETFVYPRRRSTSAELRRNKLIRVVTRFNTETMYPVWFIVHRTRVGLNYWPLSMIFFTKRFWMRFHAFPLDYFRNENITELSKLSSMSLPVGSPRRRPAGRTVVNKVWLVLEVVLNTIFRGEGVISK